MRGHSRSAGTAARSGRAPAVSIGTSLLSPSAVPYASRHGRRLRLPAGRRSRGSPARPARVRGAAGGVRAGGATRAVRDADAEHSRRVDGGRAEPATGVGILGRAGDRPSRRDARALSRGGGTGERRAQGLHARIVTLVDRAIVRLLPAVPRPVVQQLSRRYIAGPELKDARETVRRLNGEGKVATVDVLGEEITNEEEAAAI